jgi:hypothetical protein
MLARLFIALTLLVAPTLAHAQAASVTTVPGQLMNNPLVLPNPVLFSGGLATISSNGQATFGGGGTIGAAIIGQGSVSDFTLKNKSGSNVCTVATGSTTLACNTVNLTSVSANALSVGPNGTTNPSLNVDASTSSAVTGLNIKSAAATGGVAVSVLSTGTNENLTLNAKGSGTIGIGSISTGRVTITPVTTITGALTLGSVTGLTQCLQASSAGLVSGGLCGAAWYNVNNYVSLAAALTAASGVGCVYIPGGTTVAISAAVTPAAGTCITGDGPSSIVSVTSATATGIIVSHTNVVLSNFNINYSSAGTTGGSCGGDASNGAAICVTAGASGSQNYPVIRDVNIYQPWIGIYYNGNNTSVTTNVEVLSPTYIGIDIATAANNALTNVTVLNGATEADLYIYGASQGNSIVGGEWYNGAKYALEIAPNGGNEPQFNLIKGAFFDSSAQGSVITNGSNNSFTGNWFSGGRTGAGYPGLTHTAGDSNTFQGNLFINNGNDGVLVNGGTRVVFVGNVFNNNGLTTASKHGIEVAANVTDFSITGNTATANAGYGVIVDAGTSSGCIVANNLVSGNTTAPGYSLGAGTSCYAPAGSNL